MAFHIVRNDITKMNTDIIVNVANPEVVMGEGVDAAIYRVARWEELLKERKQVGEIAVGNVAITSGGRLPCKYIFHASGPSYQDGKQGEAEVLKACYEKCLKLAMTYQCESISFPLLATGFYGFPKEEAMQIAISIFREFLLKHDLEIYLVVFDSESVMVSGKLFADVASYVNEHYVTKRLQEEYYTSPSENWEDSSFEPSPKAAGSSIPNDMPKEALKAAPRKSARTVARTAPRRAVPAAPQSSSYSLDEYLKQNTGSFVKYLQRLINKRGMTNAEVYKRANLSKQYFSKIMHGQVNPTKEKLLCIAVALKLNLDETTDFLKLGGYALTPYSKVDLVFEYFIRQEKFDIFSIDIALFECGLPSLMDNH